MFSSHEKRGCVNWNDCISLEDFIINIRCFMWFETKNLSSLFIAEHGSTFGPKKQNSERLFWRSKVPKVVRSLDLHESYS